MQGYLDRHDNGVLILAIILIFHVAWPGLREDLATPGQHCNSKDLPASTSSGASPSTLVPAHCLPRFLLGHHTRTRSPPPQGVDQSYGHVVDNPVVSTPWLVPPHGHHTLASRTLLVQAQVQLRKNPERLTSGAATSCNGAREKSGTRD